jgi:transcriptional regulator with XRE-family HTH domain
MIISERIFERLSQIYMSQKEFSEQTGIRQSTISEWKARKTNPTAEKILCICKALKVSPEWLLSGTDLNNTRKDGMEYYTINKNTDMGQLIEYYNNLNPLQKERLLGYAEAMADINKTEE